ncbi:MAG: NAD-dependent epimerase/dehydratase family protein [Methylocystis sp.]|nr:NAD-dependent epimerase/dehydratase family protein [Methylocystis sp.]MCA3583989.1 NAD-dependent epimerase/dehydratase family protein [Methylocystis sp.]MCA3588908.1 NAD-dependent epimerase/dehydratase family protein [Methylocystis sp.]MCA3592516.1 NAD-dependent epimerase/dehydratase family protein [Methylocystis sp.]
MATHEVHIVTGGAGFIGSHLVEAIISRGHYVIAADNLSRGKAAYLETSLAEGRCSFIEVDCADADAFLDEVSIALAGRSAAAIWHLAANSDIPAGVADPSIDLRDTFMTTFSSLLVMKALAVPDFHFASSSAIYGDFGDTQIREDSAPYKPISNYGAMKLASEAQICAAIEAFGHKASIFRFPNVVGAPATHGVIFDFINKLRDDPTRLSVLGDGTQQKSYMHVNDLIQAMLFIADHSPEKVGIYNVGNSDDGVTVRFIAECVRDRVAPEAVIDYGIGNRGWIGDVPRFKYATDRLSALGWKPSRDSRAAICEAVRDIAASM